MCCVVLTLAEGILHNTFQQLWRRIVCWASEKKNPDQNPTGVCLGRFNLYPTQVELRSNVQTVGNVERGIVKKKNQSCWITTTTNQHWMVLISVVNCRREKCKFKPYILLRVHCAIWRSGGNLTTTTDSVSSNIRFPLFTVVDGEELNRGDYWWSKLFAS